MLKSLSQRSRFGLAALITFSCLQLAHGQVQEAAKPAQDEQPPVAAAAHDMHDRVFAVINGHAVPTTDYEQAFTTLVRQRFYHGQIPEGELAAVREEIKTKLVQRVVLLEEAGRRQIQPDDKQIEETLAGYERRYTNSPQWQQNREALLPGLRQQLAEQSLIAQLDRQVRDLPAPTDSEVRAYYDAHPELFTEPEKLRLSVILLTVDPSSPATAWQATRDEAQTIYGRLMAGADFEETARLHSNLNAEKGGDMGYLHRGMLPEAIQKKVDDFQIGKISEPVETLEGIAIFRLSERVPAQKREFSDVASRARELLIRENQDSAWKTLVESLVAKADVKFMHAASKEPHNGGGE